jgi:Gluconate 2-dehydrogenase subunit 3
MAEHGAVSSLEEFWEGLDARGVEPDLVETLRARAARSTGTVERAGDPSTVIAVAERLLPGAVPAAVLAAFLDEHFDRQLGRGDERHGVLPRDELIPAGFGALADEAQRRHGAPFADLRPADQDALLADAERGGIAGPDRFDAKEWFQRVRDLLLLGYGSDPRGMVEMGFPGPSYEKGHVWLDEFEVARRADRAPGYRQL